MIKMRLFHYQRQLLQLQMERLVYFTPTENWYFGYSVQNLITSSLTFAGVEKDYSARKYSSSLLECWRSKKNQ